MYDDYMETRQQIQYYVLKIITNQINADFKRKHVDAFSLFIECVMKQKLTTVQC